ncbi:MAG: M23 family metallopeptidase [Bacteroides sp.]|nr:M23 family metallopeptidase [Bacteroides sp.]
MNLRRLQIISIISVGASVCAEASAHNNDNENFLTGLIRSVSGNTVTNDSVIWPEDTPHDKVIIWHEHEEEQETSFTSGIDGVLTELCSLSALNFLTNAYESADFYATGKWGADGKSYTSSTFDGVLPVYDLSDFCHPIRGKITSHYGYREKFHRMHKGIDIALKIGDAVVAALPGVVGRIGYEPGGYGHFIIVVHSGGIETRYAHLSSVTATLGQSVDAGDEIALGGNSGNSTGPHLHFEVRKNGLAIDPLLVFQELEAPTDIQASK